MGSQKLGSEIAKHADFSQIRYAQCWEDADILLEALDIQPGDVCLSIVSGGDNTLAMLSRGPERVIALDMNPAQLACLELRVSAYRELKHEELLELIGSELCNNRTDLYRRCRSQLSPDVRRFWDNHSAEITQGIGGAGKFERYFSLFRNRVVPMVHSEKRIQRLLEGGTLEQREAFYDREWDTWRWRLMFKIFFSRFLMGRLGRDPSFFRYVEGSVADRFLDRSRHALTVLDPAQNPYIQWILTGRHTNSLPYALRPENFEAIRDNLDRLEWERSPIEDYVKTMAKNSVDRFNLSDIFEYISPENYHSLLESLLAVGRSGGRMAYWNTLVERRRPEHFADRLDPLIDLSDRLHQEDKAFFYTAFNVEEIL